MATHLYPEIQQPGFALDVRQWTTVQDFRAHLANYAYASTAPWARACIVHHTWSPTAAQWKGAASMQALARYYAEDLGWSAGPHLFVASGCPNPADAGIWQLTPLNMQGIHGNAANSFAWGVEHVGNYDLAPFPPDVAVLGAGAMSALLDWASVPTSTSTLQPHKQYNTNKTCPGTKIDMAAVIRAVAALHQPAPLPPLPHYYTEDDALMGVNGLGRDALARAMVQRCASSPYSDEQVASLGHAFYDLGEAGYLNGTLAAAQCCHETGNLTSARSLPPQHNTAGIGATNDGAQGVVFPSLEASATAQVGRLIAYALAPEYRTPAQDALVAEGMAARDLPAKCHGSAPYLYLLGSDPNRVDGCGWASPGQSYGKSIADIANILVELAL